MISHTQIENISRSQHLAMVGMAIAKWDELEFRHHGLGMLQAYLVEGREQELRLHIWNPELVIDEAAWSGSFHDHRFDMTSFVLAGSVHHREVDPIPGDDMQIWSVINARNVDKTERPFSGQEKTGYRVKPFEIMAGHQYFFPRGKFHQSYPVLNPAVTVILKERQVTEYARILVPNGVEPTHMTRGLELSSEVLDSVKVEALHMLQEIWYHA
jgi:hypothetical protein